MSIKFLGRFLIEKGVITGEQLLHAMKVQEEKNLRFGEYARSKGYLTDKNVTRLQEEQMRTDMKMGDLAVSLDMLTKEQVEEILVLQRNDHIFLGEALKLSGFISQDVLQKELALFKQDQQQYIADAISAPEGTRDPELVKSFVDLTGKMLKRIAQIEAKVGMGEEFSGEPEKNFAAVSVGLSGLSKCDYILSAPREAAVAIALGFMGEGTKNSSDEMIIDSVKEFCNITCGSVMARMAKKGKKISISPPVAVEPTLGRYNIVRGRSAVRYFFVTPVGDISLIIAEG